MTELRKVGSEPDGQKTLVNKDDFPPGTTFIYPYGADAYDLFLVTSDGVWDLGKQRESYFNWIGCAHLYKKVKIEAIDYSELDC